MKTSGSSPDAFRGAVPRIKVQKKNPAGEVTYEYEGILLRRDEHSIVLEALFDRADLPFMDVVFKTGDRFVEYYYTDRWYNIFAVHDREDGNVKGWYCNIGKPAVFENGTVSYIDLALDLWVSTRGEQTVLDEDEFEELELNEELKSGALRGLEELKQLFLNDKPPF
jgi:protein associated with RNAse G/E